MSSSSIEIKTELVDMNVEENCGSVKNLDMNSTTNSISNTELNQFTPNANGSHLDEEESEINQILESSTAEATNYNEADEADTIHADHNTLEFSFG